MSDEIQHLRHDRQALVVELEKVGLELKMRGNALRCPFHKDRHASAAIYQDDCDVWRFQCHTTTCAFAGDVFDVRAKRTGQRIEDVLKEANPSQQPQDRSQIKSRKEKRVYENLEALVRSIEGNVTHKYIYSDPESRETNLVVIRYVPTGGTSKKFLQARPERGGYVFGAPPKPWPLYNRNRISDALVVVVVEGEKCVHAIHDLKIAGVVATTSPCGAGKADCADWTPLTGKPVVLWPDNDDAGRKHVEGVQRALESLQTKPKAIYRVEPREFEISEHGDIIDYLERLDNGADKSKAVQEVIDTAERLSASRGLEKLIDATISGQRTAIHWPWYLIGRLTHALLPGTVTLICGDPGATKSFFLLQCLAYWYDQDIPVVVFELEEDRPYHLNRLLSQRAGDSSLQDPDWIQEHPDETREAFGNHREFMDGFGLAIQDAPEEEVSIKDLGDWVRDRAKDGNRIIAVDPVTAAGVSDKPWIDDRRFMLSVKAAVRDYDTSLILVTHPKKGRKAKIGLDELSGGAGYQRFSQTVLWIETHYPQKNFTITDIVTERNVVANRTIHLSKTRNGRGGGLALAYQFSAKTLTFEEIGIIKRERRPQELT